MIDSRPSLNGNKGLLKHIILQCLRLDPGQAIDMVSHFSKCPLIRA
jgi:hypothetical protein